MLHTNYEMRVVIQRVDKASVLINGETERHIMHGLVVLLGIETSDNQEDVDWLCNKIVQLRIFDDQEGVMNLSLVETKGEMMIISQFTLHAKTKKGNRPSYIKAARPEIAIPLYELFVEKIKALIKSKVETGVFGSHMQITMTNNGPVTIIIDTKDKE